MEAPLCRDYKLNVIQYRISDWLIEFINNSYKITEHYEYWTHSYRDTITNLNEDIKYMIKQLSETEFTHCGMISILRCDDLNVDNFKKTDWSKRLSDITIEIKKQLF